MYVYLEGGGQVTSRGISVLMTDNCNRDVAFPGSCQRKGALIRDCRDLSTEKNN